jgi:hypothetical protein
MVLAYIQWWSCAGVCKNQKSKVICDWIHRRQINNVLQPTCLGVMVLSYKTSQLLLSLNMHYAYFITTVEHFPWDFKDREHQWKLFTSNKVSKFFHFVLNFATSLNCSILMLCECSQQVLAISCTTCATWLSSWQTFINVHWACIYNINVN